MKKTILLLSLISLSVASFAQVQFVKPKLGSGIVIGPNTNSGGTRVMTIDTLRMYYDRCDTFKLYTLTPSGYIFGPGIYTKDTLLTTATGCHYDGIGNAIVTKVRAWFGATKIIGTADSVIMSICSVAPGDSSSAAVLGTAKMKVPATGAFVTIALSAAVTGPFLVVMDYTAVDDTFGLVSSDPLKHHGMGEQRARQLLNPKIIPPFGAWVPAAEIYNGGFDADVMLIPILDDVTGVGEFKNELFTLKSISPVPSAGIVSLEYDLTKATTVSYSIMDMNGKIVLQSGSQSKGAAHYKETVDMTSFAAGTYFVTFNAGTKTLTQELIIAR